MPHARDVGDGVSLPGQPFPRAPAILFALALEAAGAAREVIENDVGLDDGEAAVT